MITKESVMQALSKVNEPELHRDLVTLNMVRDLEINDGAVSFTIVLTTPACPLKNIMERDARNVVSALPGVESVKINWTSNVPVDNRIMGQLQLPVKNVVAVASGKGGVGKSTVAVNVAVALAQSGAAVGVMDADVYGPNANIMLGVRRMPPPVQVDGEPKMVPAQAYGVKLMSMGFLIKPDQPVVWRGPLLHSALRQFLTDVMWGELDYMIVDLPPGTGDVQLSLAQAVPLAGSLIVTMPQEVSQADALRGLMMFRQLDVPVLGIIENMSYLPLPDGTVMDLFGRGGGRKLAEQVGLPFLGEVPIDPRVRVGSDAGVPIVVSDPDSPAAQAFVAIAKEVAAKISLQTLSRQQESLLQVEMLE